MDQVEDLLKKILEEFKGIKANVSDISIRVDLIDSKLFDINYTLGKIERKK